jgi:chromosome condensin MukBEF MukE localization factor
MLLWPIFLDNMEFSGVESILDQEKALQQVQAALNHLCKLGQVVWQIPSNKYSWVGKRYSSL